MKSTPESRWRARVSARVLGGKIAETKKWLGTDTGQMTLVAIFVVMCIIAGAVEGSM